MWMLYLNPATWVLESFESFNEQAFSAAFIIMRPLHPCFQLPLQASHLDPAEFCANP
jgi:hypothetical protein